MVGTAPLFAVLGYLFRRSSRALSGRLAVFTGVVVLGVAVWTAAPGLQAGGWITFNQNDTPAAAAGPAGAGDTSQGGKPAADGPVRIDAAGKQVVTLTVTDF